MSIGNLLNAQSPDEETFEDIEIQPRKAQLEIDRNEIVEYKNKVQDFEMVFLNENEREVDSLKQQILNDMRRELAQSEAKIEQDKEGLKQSKKEYKLSKKRTKLSKKDLDMSEGDKADEEIYKNDKKAENRDKKLMKYFKKDYKKQKKLSKKKVKIIEKFQEYKFTFDVEHRKDNKKHKSLIYDFQELMQEDIQATEDDLKDL
jgi:hypothetical protein